MVFKSLHVYRVTIMNNACPLTLGGAEAEALMNNVLDPFTAKLLSTVVATRSLIPEQIIGLQTQDSAPQ